MRLGFLCFLVVIAIKLRIIFSLVNNLIIIIQERNKMFEILSFIGSALLGGLFKFLKQKEQQKQRAHEREMALIDKTIKSQKLAEKRGIGGNNWEQLWRVPVRPIITYMAFSAFIALPFIAIWHPVNMELCKPQTGFWAWLIGNDKLLCSYITLGPGLTWPQVHTTVTLMITGFWFGGR